MVISQYKLIGKEVNKNVIKEFIVLLKEIYRVMKEVKGMKFTSSSLLMIYDAFKESMQRAIVKLIDFENAEEGEKEDSNALEGIDNLCKTLEELYSQ